MDYDDDDFENQNLHLIGEANNKFPPVLQPYPLPKFDFDDTLNSHLRFDSLGESEAFLGIEGNEDNNWIENFSRESSGIVFSSGATDPCAISRHINVWSEATSSESVEMLLNSVGQDEVIVRENSIKKSDTSGELGCTMEPVEPGQTSHEKSNSKEETTNLQPNSSVDANPAESSVVKADAMQEQVPVKDDSPTAAEEESLEEKNIALASTATVEAVDTSGRDKIGTETTDHLLDEAEDKVYAESVMEDGCRDGTVQTVITSSCELNVITSSAELNVITSSGELHNEKTLLPETQNDENVISDHIQSSYNRSEITESVSVETHSDSHVGSASEVENVGAENIGETAKPNLKETDLSDVTVLERRDQGLSTLEVGGQDVSGTQCQDHLVSTVHTCKAVETSLELAGELTTIANSVSIEKPESPCHQHLEVNPSKESTFQTETETHTQIHVETSEIIYISPTDSLVEATQGSVAMMSDEGSARTFNLEQSMEVPVNANDGDQDVKESQILSESVVSEFVGYVSGGSTSKLAESKTQSDTIPTDKSGTIIDGARTVGLTSSIDLHMVKISSDASDQGSFSGTEKVSSGEPENGQTLPPVDAISSGSQMDQQARKHAEDPQQNTNFVEGFPSSEGLKDAVHAAEPESGQTLPPVDAISSGIQMDQQARKHAEDPQQNTNFVEGFPGSEGLKDAVYATEPENGQTLPPVDAISSGSRMDQQARKHVEDPQQNKNFVEGFPSSEGLKDAVYAAEPESGQTLPPVDAISSGSQMDQQARKHAEDPQQNTNFVEGFPGSEGLKEAVYATDSSGQALPQQSEEKLLEEHVGREVAKTREIESTVDKDNMNANSSTSSSANLGSEAGKDGREENNTTASGRIMTAGTPVSQPQGHTTVLGDFLASTCSEPSVKSHVTATKDAATNLKTALNSFPDVKSTEFQLNTTETNSVKKSEDHNISSFMSAGSPVVNRNETFSGEMNTTPDQLKGVDISKAVNFSQATLVSPVVVGSPSTSSLVKTTAKLSKTKTERKPRRTSKSVETSRKGTSVKGATSSQQFQSGGKTNAVDTNLASPFQIKQSTEKEQSLHNSNLKSVGTLSTPTASLPDLNSSGLSSILRRPFTDLQQVQLRAQIFVYGALIQGTAPDEAYMISAFGGPDGGKDGWEKAWRCCVVRAQKSLVATPQTPLQSHAGKMETPSAGHTSRKDSSATNSMIPLSSPLWSISTPLGTLQPSSTQRSLATHQQFISSSHPHQTPPTTNIVVHNTTGTSPLPFHNTWLASQQTSGFDVRSLVPIYPITEPVKLTPVKESYSTYSGAKHVQSGTPSSVFKVTPTLEPTSTVVAPAHYSTGTKSRKRKKMPVSVESGPSILNVVKQTELAASPLMSTSTVTAEPITPAPAHLGSNAGTLPNVVSISAVPMNLVSTFPAKKMKSSLPSPIFGGNLVSEVKQRSIFSEDTIDKLKEAKMHAEDASAIATAAVSHSEYVWKQLEQQKHVGIQQETQDRLASAAVTIAAAAAVAKAAAAAANVAANAALQAKLMAEEAFLPSASDQGLPTENIFPGQGTPASMLKGEGSVASSSSVLIAAREAAKKRVEAATAATKYAENMDSIVKAAELTSEAVSQAGILVSMGHPPLLNKLIEVGPSNYWRQAQGSQDVQPCKTVGLEKETVATSEGTFASPRTVQTELAGTVKTADVVSGPFSAIGKGKEQKGDKGVVFEPEVGTKFSIDTQTESQLSMKATNNDDIKEGSKVEVFKEEPGLKTAWYSADVMSLVDDKAYVLFNDLSVEQGTDKLKEWVALKGEGDQAPKIRTARSITTIPYEGTRKRRRAAIGDHVWKIGDRVDSWVHDSWLEGVITEKNKKDENTVTVHFPAQGDTLMIKAWNLRPSLVWKDGKWIECSSSGENISSSHEGDTPKEKRPRFAAPALVAEVKDTSMKIVDDPGLGIPPQTGVLDVGVSENTFNIGRSTREDNKPDQLRMKRTGLQKQGSKVIFGVPKPGKKRKFMDVSKHYVSEASTKTRERKEPAKPAIGSWRMPSKTISREKQTTVPKPKTFKPTLKPKEKPDATARILPRKDLRSTTASGMESDNAAEESAENKDPASDVLFKGTVEEQAISSSHDTGSKNTSSSGTNKGKVASTTGRLAKIEEDKALPENSSKTSEGMEPRRSVRRIQPTSRLLEGIQTSMMSSKIPSVPHSKSHQSQSKK